MAHVLDRAREARSLNRILVATDDDRIAAVVRREGGEAVLTPSNLPSGSDRVLAAAEDCGEEFDIVVNIQGDEPFLPGEAMDLAVDRLVQNSECDMATVAVPAQDQDEGNPNVVKVVVDKSGRARYFSRGNLPYPWGNRGGRRLKHVGLYAFQTHYLMRFVGMGVSELEAREGLEQLRALEDGAYISVVVGDWPVLGVDTPHDLVLAESRLAEMARVNLKGETT